MSDALGEAYRVPPEVQARLNAKAEAAKEVDSFNDRLYKAGLNVFKWGVAYPAGFIAEYLMPPGTSWLIRLIPIGIGYGLDKLGTLNPRQEGGKTRLIRALGQGLWKGGGFGLASMMVLNTVFEPQIGKQFSENVVQAVASMPAKKAFVFPGGPPTINILDGLHRLDQTMSNFLRIK